MTVNTMTAKKCLVACVCVCVCKGYNSYLTLMWLQLGV